MPPVRAPRPPSGSLRAALAALAALAATQGSTQAHAKPELSRLHDILARTATVVVAKREGGSQRDGTARARYPLRVERTLRGTARPGARITPEAPGGPVGQAGERLVAFIDDKDTWIATATLLAGPSLEAGTVRVDGVSAGDAHHLEPGVVTFSELEGHLTQGQPMLPVFRGRLLLAAPAPDATTDTADLAPSSFELTATSALCSNAACIRGLPELAGFPSPVLVTHNWSDSVELTIAYRDGSPRPLMFSGRVTGKHQSGHIAAEFWLSRPAFLDEASLRRYLGDAKVPDPVYALEIRAGSERIPLVLDTYGRARSRLGSAPVTELTLQPGTGTLQAGGTRLTWSTGTSGRPPGIDDDSALVVAGLTSIGPAACTLTRGTTRTPCTLHYLGVRFPAAPAPAPAPATAPAPPHKPAPGRR